MRDLGDGVDSILRYGRVPGHRVGVTSANNDLRRVEGGHHQAREHVLHRELRIDDPDPPHALGLEPGDERRPALEGLAWADPHADVELRHLPVTFFCLRLTASLRSGLAAAVARSCWACSRSSPATPRRSSRFKLAFVPCTAARGEVPSRSANA